MRETWRRPATAFGYGAPIGMLGGMIGLGGAEFRLPVLKAAFGYSTLRAVALNLAVSLITLVASLVIRLPQTSADALLPLAPVMAGLIAGSMLGAVIGAAYASRVSVERLERLIMVLLIAIGGALLVEAFLPMQGAGVPFGLAGRIPLAALLGVGIGLVSSLLGVAGGELIIPTLVFVFGADIRVAGTASVMISLPTVAVGLARYARKRSFEPQDRRELIAPMGAGSVVGALLGGVLVPFVPVGALKVVLGAILVVSAVRIFRHRETIRVATTTSLRDSGLLSPALAEFERRTRLHAIVAAVGSGKAAELLRAGEAEVALTHAPGMEERLRADGVVDERVPFVQTEFVLVGPHGAADVLCGASSVGEAMRRVASSGRPFVSRGDGSGTHLRERELWSAAGVSDLAFVVSAGGGMAETLLVASERGAFALSDRPTFAAHRESLALAVAYEGDGEMLSVYSMLVPRHTSAAKARSAQALAQFVRSPEFRSIVARHGQFAPAA